MYPQVLLKNRKPDRIITLEEYRQDGGYTALQTALSGMRSMDVEQVISYADILGRGGAAFPMGKKLETVRPDAPFPRYVVCNCDEMEPGTFKDRVLIHANPHQLIEGMILAAYAIKSEYGILFVRPEYEDAARIMEREIHLAKEQGYLGKNILGSGFDFDINVHRSGGRYICGEGTALLNAIDGRRANPKRPPPYPTESGLWNRPTLVQNVETLSCVPHVINNGAKWFQSLALTPEGAGTKVFSISGKVKKPGCYELPLGVKMSEIIEKFAGGMQEGSEFKACLPGGASTQFIGKEFYDIKMDFKSLQDAGFRLGTGAMMVFDHKTCLVEATLNLIEFFARESCGWCTPCREGLPYIRDLLWRIENGQGEEWFVPKLKTMSHHLYKAYCAFAAGAAAPVESLLQYFGDEVSTHIEIGQCPLKVK